MFVAHSLRRLAAIGTAVAPALALTFALSVAAAAQEAPGSPPAAFAPSGVDAQTDLRINEVMADNKSTLSDPDEPGEAPDWIEIYNPTNQVVSLDGLALSDDEENQIKFPITNGLTIPARGYLIFYADEDPRQGPTHTNYKLGQNGEFIGLHRVADLRQVDAFEFPPLATDQSYGRLPDGSTTLRLLPFATPNTTNGGDPPQILDVSKPPIPAPANQPVTVTAIVTDIDAIVSVTIVYSTTGGGEQSVAMAPVGGANYSGQIPGLPAGVLVNYYVRATDEDGENSRLPLAGRTYSYLTGYVAPALIINEIAYWNLMVPDAAEPAEFPDWIEIYNPTDAAISLNGLSLSDDKDDPLKYRIPNGLTIVARGRLVFLADDDAGQGPLHLNFELKREGEYVGLFGGEGTVKIDSYDPKGESRIGASGRIPDGSTAEDAWSDTVCPTFNRANRNCDNAQFLPRVSR